MHAHGKVPGMSITEATKILQIQDRQIKKIPEVERVFGKAGQAETPTDPAPISMFETVVSFKPHDQWRPGSDAGQDHRGGNEREYQHAGNGEYFLDADPDPHGDAHHGIPQRAGGESVLGPDLGKIQEVAIQIEKALTDLAGYAKCFRRADHRRIFSGFHGGSGGGGALRAECE